MRGSYAARAITDCSFHLTFWQNTAFRTSAILKLPVDSAGVATFLLLGNSFSVRSDGFACGYWCSATRQRSRGYPHFIFSGTWGYHEQSSPGVTTGLRSLQFLHWLLLTRRPQPVHNDCTPKGNWFWADMGWFSCQEGDKPGAIKKHHRNRGCPDVKYCPRFLHSQTKNCSLRVVETCFRPNAITTYKQRLLFWLYLIVISYTVDIIRSIYYYYFFEHTLCFVQGLLV